MTGSTTGRWLVPVLTACCAFAAAACVPPTLNASSSATLTPKAKGETLYAQCKGCHTAGPDLKGLSFTKIKEGLKKPAMAAFKDMTDDEIAAIMAHLATLN